MKFKLIYVIYDDYIYVFTALWLLESLNIAEKILVVDNGKKQLIS